MALDTSAMSAQTALLSDKLITKAIANAATAQLLISSQNFQSGVKTSGAVLKMSANIVVQDGATCSRNPLDNSVFSDTKIEVAPLKTNDNICAKTFYNTYLQSKVSKGQNDETIDGAVIEAITSKKIEAIGAYNERLLWSGDKALAGSNELHFIDGIRKQAKTGGATLLTVTTGSTISTLSKLQEAYLKTNINVRHDEDFYAFIGEDTYDYILMDLAKLNVFKPVEDNKLYGSRAKFQVVPGLNGTGEVYFGKLENLQLGTDGEGDMDTVQIKESPIDQNWFMDFNWTLGIKVIYPEEFAYAVGI